MVIMMSIYLVSPPPLFMYVCVYVYVYVYVYVCVCVCVCMYMYVCMYVCMCVYIYIMFVCNECQLNENKEKYFANESCGKGRGTADGKYIQIPK